MNFTLALCCAFGRLEKDSQQLEGGDPMSSEIKRKAKVLMLGQARVGATSGAR
jgi:hypothetical protein